MNTLKDAQQYLSDAKDLVSNMSPEMALVVALIILGAMLKACPVLNNKWIPWILFLVSVTVYPLLIAKAQNSIVQQGIYYFPWVRDCLNGAIYWFVAEAVYQKFLKKYESNFPGLFPDAAPTTADDKDPPASPVVPAVKGQP